MTPSEITLITPPPASQPRRVRLSIKEQQHSKQEWLAVARRVNSGEFDRSDRSTCEAVIIGIQGYNLKEFTQAADRLKLVLKR